MIEFLYALPILWILIISAVLITGAAEIGSRIGLHSYRASNDSRDVGTLAAAALGLLALLIGFSFAMAVDRYESRRNAILEEANAIGSTANFTLMLPREAQKPILDLLREYTQVRIGLGLPHDPEKQQRDINRSVELQSQLWRHAVAAATAAPQSLPTNQFVSNLNELNNVHERRLTALRNNVPLVILLMLVMTSMVAMGFTGYNEGITGVRRHMANALMSLTIAILIATVIDLNRPTRGLILVSTQALVDTAENLPRGD